MIPRTQSIENRVRSCSIEPNYIFCGTVNEKIANLTKNLLRLLTTEQAAANHVRGPKGGRSRRPL